MPWSFCGFGTGYLGQRELQRDGSYVTTEFLIALGIPLVPLGSQRVREAGAASFRSSAVGWTSQQQYETRAVPMNWRQVLNVYLGAVGVVAAIVLTLATPALLFAAADKDPVVRLTAIIMLVLAGMAVAAVVYVIRRQVRLRAEWAKKTARR